jgi:hypothetical protein
MRKPTAMYYNYEESGTVAAFAMNAILPAPDNAQVQCR